MFEEEDDAQLDGQLKGDLNHFESFLTGTPLGYIDSDRLEAIVDFYIESGEFNKAKRAAEIADTNFSFNPVFKLRIAQSYIGLNLFTDALNILSKLDEVGLPKLEVYLSYAIVFAHLNDFQSAVHYLTLSIPLAEKEDLMEIYLDLSGAYHKLEDEEASIEVLKKGIDTLSDADPLLYELAYKFDHLGRFQEAVDVYLKYIESNPYANMAWYNLGNAYSKLELFEKAIWAYDYSILIFEDFAPTHFNMGNAYLSLGKYHQAIDRFKFVLSLEGDDPMALCYLGESHEQLKEYEIAINYYRLCLEFDPNIYEAWLGLGIITDIQGKTVEAIALIHKALDCDPDNASIHLVLANAYQKACDFDEAKRYYNSALILDFQDQEILEDYVLFMLEQNPLNALEVLESHQVELEMNESFVQLLTHTLIQLGRYHEAHLLFSSLVAVDREQAKTIVDWNPNLLNRKEFVNLLHE